MNKRKHMVAAITVATFFLVFELIFTGCSQHNAAVRNAGKAVTEADRIIIWTNCSEFTQYVEYFNKTHKSTKAVIVYKKNPADSMPPAKDEQRPDIIVGSWLRTDEIEKNLKPLNYLFDRNLLATSMFYPQLVNSGVYKHKQVLLPVSFNLPAIIFDTNNKELIPDSYTLTLDQISSTAAGYSQRKKTGAYTRIGFTPLSNEDFLYLVSKLKGSDFRLEKDSIVWKQEKLDDSVNYIKNWIQTENSTAQEQTDFAFKYLFMPSYKQVTSGKTLFAYTTSDSLFKEYKQQEVNVDYRWICDDGKIPIEDSFTMLGIYKNCNNQVGASEFISWFFQAQTQKEILERKIKLNLETEQFGIAGGFSSVKEVTEHILPLYYTQLFSNLPPEEMITVSQKLPSRWESYKSAVVTPYLSETISQDSAKTVAEYEKEWRKKVFD